MMLIGYLILACAVIAAFVSIEVARHERVRQLNAINQQQCSSLRNLYVVIQQTLVESDKRIDELDYYRAHPQERRRAHAANQAIIERFRLPPCPARINVR